MPVPLVFQHSVRDRMAERLAMHESPAYTEFHPRWYRPRVSTYWWLWQWRYMKFVLREISSTFAAWFVVVTLYQVHALRSGPAAYSRFALRLENPVVLALNVVSLFFVVLHTITWFDLTPKAMVLRVGGRRVPGALVVASNYAAWLVVSAIVAKILLEG
jgi:fumarate reductase subunit C